MALAPISLVFVFCYFPHETAIRAAKWIEANLSHPHAKSLGSEWSKEVAI